MDNRTPQAVKVERPWGEFEQYTHNLPSTVKVITVRPKGKLSLQYHRKRDELWIILDPGVQVELEDKILRPQPGEKIFIPRETPHRLSAFEDEPVRFWRYLLGSSMRKTLCGSRMSMVA